jgi:exodeoxyribonuclease VII large subunit
VVRKENGEIARSHSQLSVGEVLSVELGEGNVKVKVVE